MRKPRFQKTSCFKSILPGQSHRLPEILKLDSLEGLRQLEMDGRIVCPSCGRRRSIYCCTCVRFVMKEGRGEIQFPRLSLPLHVDIMKHVSELESKSTALHAKLLAPDYVTLYSYPAQLVRLEEYMRGSACVLLFPTADSLSINQVDWSNMKRLIVLDGTWNQVRGMSSHPVLQKLPRIHIENVETLFWRSNGHGKEDRPDLLSTIEAIYHFFRQYTIMTAGHYEGQYDNLLFLFIAAYVKIRESMSFRLKNKCS
jgi:DTW domain-containing protein YfiP